ncbi:MAG: indole-3-glycerol phosphate synthase TrpC, partial [Thermoleophilia bacterium]
MTGNDDTFLARMCAASAARVASGRRERPLVAPARRLGAAHPHRLIAALRAPRAAGLAVIAEIKRASPSKGPLAPQLDAVEQARRYERAGADAISVLTEPTVFAGSLADLAAVAAAVPLPALRKDFIVDEYQLLEARAAGAAAVLLIAAALPGARLAELHAACDELDLDALVEVHDEVDLERALALGCPLIGINNRDLRTLVVSVGVTERLAATVTSGAVIVSESGIDGAAAATRVAA